MRLCIISDVLIEEDINKNMDSFVRETSLFTASQLKEKYPDLPQIVDQELSTIETEQPETTTKFAEEILLIIAIARFIIDLTKFVRDWIRENKNLSESEKEEELKNSIAQNFQNPYEEEIDDETKDKIVKALIKKILND